MNLGNKIKKLRMRKNITQQELANELFVSDKTVSSWENNRTLPDMNVLYKLSNYFNTSIYYFIVNEENYEKRKEIQVKIKTDEYSFIKLKKIVSEGTFIEQVQQHDVYFEPTINEFNNKWIRIRNNGKYNILNYKCKISDMEFYKYDIIFDNKENMIKILEGIGLINIGTIEKNRIKYKYKDCEINFDDVRGIGYFIEIKNYFNESYNNLGDTSIIKVMEELKIDFKNIDNKKYIDYLKQEN